MSKSHLAKSRVLEEIIIQLRKKDQQIPPNIMSDLKSARTLMQIESEKPRGHVGENEPKIDQYIANVESYVVSEAEKLFSREQVEIWLTKLDLATCDSCVTVVKPKQDSKFIAGVPRNQRWVRVEPIPSLPKETLQKMIKETNLSLREDEDGHLIAYGDEKDVKAFVKKMTAKNGKVA